MTIHNSCGMVTDQKERGPLASEDFRRGPTSVEAVRRGEVGLAFDTTHVRTAVL